jgi:hypothetical protein
MYPIFFRSRYLDPVFIEAQKAKSSTTRSIKSPYKKTSKVYFYVGCSYEDLRNHIEKQFLKGMSWENHGEWHLDHIIPMALAKTKRDVKKLSNFTNLRPLWRKDNISKKDKRLFLI